MALRRSKRAFILAVQQIAIQIRVNSEARRRAGVGKKASQASV